MEKAEIIENEVENRIYEISYLITPNFTEEEVTSTILKIKDIISKKGGKSFYEENPKKIPLAYTMIKKINNKNERFDDAYFGWVKFESEPAFIDEIEFEVKRLEPIVRYLLVKTTRENTFIPRKFSSSRRAPQLTSKEEIVPLDEVALEKELDAMASDVE